MHRTSRRRSLLRSQRAANQAGLNRVRSSLASMKGATHKSEMHKVLRRMEDEHLKAAQRWDYKKTCLQQERTRLMELAMEAFCKVVYVDRGWREHTANHARVPRPMGMDFQMLPASSAAPLPSSKYAKESNKGRLQDRILHSKKRAATQAVTLSVEGRTLDRL